jgi:hypothetical protein
LEAVRQAKTVEYFRRFITVTRAPRPMLSQAKQQRQKVTRKSKAKRQRQKLAKRTPFFQSKTFRRLPVWLKRLSVKYEALCAIIRRLLSPTSNDPRTADEFYTLATPRRTTRRLQAPKSQLPTPNAQISSPGRSDVPSSRRAEFTHVKIRTQNLRAQNLRAESTRAKFTHAEFTHAEFTHAASDAQNLHERQQRRTFDF